MATLEVRQVSMQPVVVCPYCRRTQPAPLKEGLTHFCRCGAAFAALPDQSFREGLARLVKSLFQESLRPTVELLDSCQVTIYRDYPPKPDHPSQTELAGLVREIRFQPTASIPVSLVWVTRSDAPEMLNPHLKPPN